MSARLRRSPRPLATLAAALLCATLLASCGGDDGDSATDAGAETSEATGSEDAAGTACEYVEDGMPPAKEVEPPPAQPAATGPVPVELATSAGAINAELDGAATPCTVNSFLSLAEQGYYDDTQCHRLTTQGIFVLQCGDPTGTGTGGPGYSYADELSGEETYPAGTLAMANAGPDTNGSQFFIVYDDTELPPSYTVFGQLDDAGLDVVRKVAAKGTANGGSDGPPKKTVTIESVTQG
jgi:peptidyl-prolyl cis-trans isomerase B (cyclophilin B)